MTVVLSVNISGPLSLIEVKHASEDTNGKTDVATDGGSRCPGTELIATMSVGDYFATPCLGVTIKETTEEATGLAETVSVASEGTKDGEAVVLLGTKHKYHVLKVKTTTANVDKEKHESHANL